MDGASHPSEKQTQIERLFLALNKYCNLEVNDTVLFLSYTPFAEHSLGAPPAATLIQILKFIARTPRTNTIHDNTLFITLACRSNSEDLSTEGLEKLHQMCLVLEITQIGLYVFLCYKLVREHGAIDLSIDEINLLILQLLA